MKKTVKTTEIVKNADGTISEVSKVHVEIIPNEPDFVKMFFHEEVRFKLSSGEYNVLLYLLSKMGYDNKVSVPLGLKKQICHELGFYKAGTRGVGGVLLKEDENGLPQISVNTLNSIIWRLISKNLVAKVSQGIYVINPFYFAKGKWKAITTNFDYYEKVCNDNAAAARKKSEAKDKRDENLKKGRDRIRL